jgi:ABC-type polysaccharide/polyol phosphate export permease
MRYMPLLKNLISRELKKKYRQSILGYVWCVLNPLLVMIIIGLAVANIMLDRQKSWDVEYEMVNKHIEWTWAGR